MIMISYEFIIAIHSRYFVLLVCSLIDVSLFFVSLHLKPKVSNKCSNKIIVPDS